MSYLNQKFLRSGTSLTVAVAFAIGASSCMGTSTTSSNIQAATAPGSNGLALPSSNTPGSTLGSGGTTPSSPGSPGAPAPVVPATQIAVMAISGQSLNLGTSVTVPVTLSSLAGYSGPVALSVNTAALVKQDPNNTMTVAIAPTSVMVTAGGSGTATLSIASTASSPDINIPITLIASTPNGKVLASVPVTVNAVYDVNIMDVGNLASTGIEDWSVPGGTTTKFATHPNGITVRFNNLDMVQKSGFYRIHSSATAFAHEGGEGLGLPGSTTPKAADGTGDNTLGPNYTCLVTTQTANVKDTYYDHNNENAGAAGRTMIFNAFAPVVLTPTNNPDATYTYLSTNLFQGSQCVACHVTNPSQGNNISLATYAAVLNQVSAGSAAGSPLYVAIAPGGDMPKGAPGTVSSALVQDVSDWINAGAPND